MNFSKLTLAVATVLGAGATSSAFAIDLYVDVKTKQIYAEPGPHRQLMGSFVKADEAAAMAAPKPAESTELAAVKEDLELKTNEIKALQEHMSEAEKVKVKADKKGLQIESADGDFKFKVSGRLQGDANFSDGDRFLPATNGVPIAGGVPQYANDGTELRRARLRLNGTLYKDWNFILESDFAKNGVAIKDAFLEYTGFDIGSIVVGHQKQLFSNELWMSSNDLLFMERSLMNVLNNPTVERAIGASFQTHGENWYAGTGVFGDSIGVNTATTIDPITGQKVKTGVTEGWGTSARATYAPIMEKDKLIHLGIAGNYRKTDNTNGTLGNSNVTYRYQTTNMSGINLLNTTFTDIQSIKQLGLEAAGMYGPFSMQGEYTASWMDRTGGKTSIGYDGWYVESAWSLTGESRKYDGAEGKFKRLKPSKNFSPSNGGWGAFELAGRYASVNLNDKDAMNGAMSNISIGLNWYMNENIRFMADWTKTLDVKNPSLIPASGDISNLDVYQFRGQWAF